MDGSVPEEKSSFKMLGLTFSSKLDWGSYIISIAKTSSNKTGALIHSIKFISSEVALYLYKSNRVHDFSVTIPRCYKDIYVNSSLACTARLWNSLPIECFPFTYDLNGFKSRINRHLLTVGSF